MKKYVKKIICVIAILVVCVSSLVVPCFAYGEFLPDRSGSAPYIGILPTVEVSYQSNPDSNGNGVASYTDTPPAHLIAGFTDGLRNNDIYHTNYVLNDGTITYGENVNYVRYGVLDNFLTLGKNVTYTIIFPQSVIDVKNQYSYFPKIENIRHNGFEGIYYRYTYTAYSRTNGFVETEVVMQNDVSVNSLNIYDNIYQHYSNSPDVDYVIVSEFAVVIEHYSSTAYTVQPFDISIPYSTSSTISYTPALTLYDDTQKIEIVYIDDIDVGTFLWNSVKNFLNIEIVGGITLYQLFIVVVSIPLCIWLLKLFAGG